jgi:hypothetical protein
MEKTTVKAVQEGLVQKMKEWQEIESTAIKTTREIGVKTENPLIKNIMITLNYDSARHRSVQQFIIDSLEKEHLTLSINDLGDVWTMIEKHIALEQKMVSLVKEVLETVKGKKTLMVQQYFLEYLLADEEKHEAMLNKLHSIKDGIYPYGG